MRTDTVLRVDAMKALISQLGEVDAERYVAIVKTDDFDYTEWRRDLWSDKSIDEIHNMATAFEAQSA